MNRVLLFYRIQLHELSVNKVKKDYEVWKEALMSVGEDESGDWTDKLYLKPLI